MRATRHRSLLLGLILVPLAVPAHARSLVGGSRGPGAVAVTVREVPAADAWQVSFHLPQRAAGVDFPHGRGAFRRAGWSVSPAGATWVDAPDVERLCFPRPLRDFGVSFRTDTSRRPKDYEVQVAMSDGGRLFYTGQVLVRPLATCGAGAAATPLPGEPVHRFRLATAADRAIRTGARSALGALAWEPKPGVEETYVYFGHATGSPGAPVDLVEDPALPSWLRQDLESTVAKVLDRFAGETGLALPARPLVLLSYDPRGSGRSFDGGVLGGTVQLGVSGDGWTQPTDEARVEWLTRLSHELFHLWDGSLLHADGESEWLAEAAAEAFALRALYGLGALDERKVAERLVDLANQCLAGLEGQSLLAAPARGAWDTWYSCGPVLLFVAGQAVERTHPGQGGLGLLVREMFAEGRAAGGVYGTGTFLGWLDKLSGDRPTVHAIQGLIRRGAPRGADEILAAQLTGAGYRVRLAAPEAAAASPRVFGVLLRRGLVRCACGTATAGAEAPAPEGDCARFSGDERIETVGDVEVRRDPAGAYARLRSAAGLGRPLRVVTGADPQPLTLFCGRDTLDPTVDRLLVLQQ
jgi:hypothetical protein